MNASICFAILAVFYCSYVLTMWSMYVTKMNEWSGSPTLAVLFPHTIDSRWDGKVWRRDELDGIGDFMMRLSQMAVLVLLFAVQHSLMARDWFKQRVTNRLGGLERANYVLFASACQHAIIAYAPTMPTMLYEPSGSMKMALQMLQMCAFIGLTAAMAALDFFELMGLRQVWKSEEAAKEGMKQPEVAKKRPLIMTGIFGVIRHPIMLGMLTTLWIAPDMSIGRLLLNCLLTAYIFVAVRYYEEPDLRCAFREYAEYQRLVPAVCPNSLRSHARECARIKQAE